MNLTPGRGDIIMDKARIETALKQLDDITVELPPVENPSKESRKARLDRLADEAASALAGKSNHSLGNPWDKGQFLERVSTYLTWTWFAKPVSLDPLECARHGWKNEDKDLLSCSSCSARLRFLVDDQLNQESKQRYFRSFRAKLSTGHHDLCPWKHNRCCISFAQFPARTHRQLLRDYRTRVSTLGSFATRVSTATTATTSTSASTSMEAEPSTEEGEGGGDDSPHRPPSYPFPRPRFSPSFTSGLGELGLSTDDIIIPPPPTPTPSAAAAATALAPVPGCEDLTPAQAQAVHVLALFGWELVPRASSVSSSSVSSTSHVATSELELRCELCCRRVGLWNFMDGVGSSSSSSSSSGITSVSDGRGGGGGDEDPVGCGRSNKRPRLTAPPHTTTTTPASPPRPSSTASPHSNSQSNSHPPSSSRVGVFSSPSPAATSGRFDPVKEHRPFCPWVQPRIDGGDPAAAAAAAAAATPGGGGGRSVVPCPSTPGWRQVLGVLGWEREQEKVRVEEERLAGVGAATSAAAAGSEGGGAAEGGDGEGETAVSVNGAETWTKAADALSSIRRILGDALY